MTSAASIRLLLAFLLLLAGLVYVPGLSGGFVFDDLPNLVHNERLAAVAGWDGQAIWRAVWSSESGPLKRPLSMLSFALNHAAAGMSPFAFKLTNVFIHLVCGALIFALVRTVLGQHGTRFRADGMPQGDLVALLVAGMWLLHPLQLTGVLYVVQRMASLAALFCLLGMWVYAVGRVRQLQGRPGWLLIASAYLLFLPLAALSKENGALLPLFLLLLELCFFRFRAAAGGLGAGVMALHAVCAVIPFVTGAIYLLLQPDWILRSYSNRDFTLTERVLTQARALWFYLSMIAVPDITRMGLYHDDFSVSRALFDPPLTALALGGWVMLPILALAALRRWPVFAFGVLFFLAAHALESSFFGLEMVHEHRNYLASLGPLLILASLLAACPGYWPQTHRAVIGGACVILVALAFTTGVRAWYWGDDLRRADFEARHHPQSVRSLVEIGGLQVRQSLSGEGPENWLIEARQHFERAAELERYDALGHLGVLVTDNRLGREVDERWLQRTLERLSAPPMASSTPDAFISLLRCRRAGQCSFDDELLFRLDEALHANPDLRLRDRARIDADFAQLFMDVGHVEYALWYARRAVLHAPSEPQLWLNLCAAFLAAGRVEDAQRALDEVQGLDADGFFRPRIEAMQIQITRWRERNQTG